MLQFDSPVRVKLTHVNPRKELHGEDLKQAIDLDFSFETMNTALDMLNPLLRESFYFNNRQNESQVPVEGVAPVTPNLRVASIEWPLKLDSKDEGRFVTITPCVGKRKALSLPECKVGKVRFTCKEGGATTITFQAQANKDVTKEHVGDLCDLEGSEVELVLTGATTKAAADARDRAR